MNKRFQPGQRCFIVAEIGINHNGDLTLAKRLIDAAMEARCDAVKFQKRIVDIVYSPEELATARPSPFGQTNGDLKRGLELSLAAYDEIDRYCHRVRMPWFVSCWDELSIDQMSRYDLPCLKIASPSLTDDSLLRRTRSAGLPILLSTGMSTLDEIDHAVETLGREDLILLHACSAYPAYHAELNLRLIQTLRDRYHVPTGYSGHESGIASSLAAVAMGACVLERHFTLDRSLWGSDHAISLEPSEMKQLVEQVRQLEQALGDGVKRLLERELPALRKLRRVGSPVAV